MSAVRSVEAAAATNSRRRHLLRAVEKTQQDLPAAVANLDCMLGVCCYSNSGLIVDQLFFVGIKKRKECVREVRL